MPFLSINEYHKLTGKTRATVTKMLDGVPFKEGPKAAKLYESKLALQKIYQAADADGEAFINTPEAQRLLTLARKEEIELNMEVTRGSRIPLDTIRDVNDRAHSNVAGMLKAHAGKMLTEEAIQDMLTELREIGEAIT